MDKKENLIMRTKEIFHCDLCNSEGEFIFKGLNDRIFDTPGDWNLKKCLNAECGLVWLDPMPIEEDIYLAYKSYFTHTKRELKRKSLRSFFLTVVRRTYFVFSGAYGLRRLGREYQKMYLPVNSKGHLLEVGCGDGFRLDRMRTLGWNVEGQEVDPKAAEVASKNYGIKIHIGKLEDIDLPSNTYDSIIMVHVIEHVHDFYSILKECFRLLKPNGTLVFITPNISSFGYNTFGVNWLHLDPPRHLHLFSPRSMKILIEKIGFKSYDITTIPIDAASTYSGSKKISLSGKLSNTAPKRVFDSIQEMIYHRKAYNKYRKDCLSGEEIVVKIYKN